MLRSLAAPLALALLVALVLPAPGSAADRTLLVKNRRAVPVNKSLAAATRFELAPPQVKAAPRPLPAQEKIRRLADLNVHELSTSIELTPGHPVERGSTLWFAHPVHVAAEADGGFAFLRSQSEINSTTGEPDRFVCIRFRPWVPGRYVIEFRLYNVRTVHVSTSPGTTSTFNDVSPNVLTVVDASEELLSVRLLAESYRSKDPWCFYGATITLVK